MSPAVAAAEPMKPRRSTLGVFVFGRFVSLAMFSPQNPCNSPGTSKRYHKSEPGFASSAEVLEMSARLNL